MARLQKAEEMRKQKEAYAEELRRQRREDEERARQEHRMTNFEKRLNYDNLQAYKVWDPNNYAGIPGWGGNAKYYNELLKKGQVRTSLPLGTEGRAGFDFASHANNLLSK